MEQDMLILGYKGYSFLQDGKEVSGAKMHMVNLNPSSEQLIKGHLPISQNFDLDYVQNFDVFPGIYKCKFEMVPGKNGKASLEIVSISFKCPVEFKQQVNK